MSCYEELLTIGVDIIFAWNCQAYWNLSVLNKIESLFGIVQHWLIQITWPLFRSKRQSRRQGALTGDDVI